MKVTYQGVIGCFSSMVCERCFPDAVHRSCLTFGDAMQSVVNGEADVAVIPVENSTAGRVTEVYGILPESSLFITGEAFLPVHYCLMMPTKFVRGLPPQNLSDDELLAWKRSAPTADELKAIPKGTFVVMKTGKHPMQTKLRLFLDWGITFDEPYQIEERVSRKIAYADRDELIRSILKKYPPKELLERPRSCVRREAPAQEQSDSNKLEALHIPKREDYS